MWITDRARSRSRAGRARRRKQRSRSGDGHGEPGDAASAGRLAQSMSRPTSPPSQSEPDDEMEPVEQERERRAARSAPAWPEVPGTTSTAPAAASTPPMPARLGDRAVLALGPVDPERDPGRDAEQREAELEVDVAAPERGHAEQRDERPDVEGRPQRVDRGRDVEVDGDREQAEHRGDRERDRDGAQARPRDPPGDRPGDREPHARTGRSRSSRSGTSTQRATRSGVRRRRARAMCGTRNCGAGPGVRADREGERALHRMPVDRDGPPVDEVPALRQVRAERHDERVGVRRRAARRAGRLLVAVLRR